MKIAKALDMNILVYTRTPREEEEMYIILIWKRY